MNKQDKILNLNENSPWTDRHWIIAILIVGLGILLRFMDLGDKPYHHDEAIFGMYAFYQFTDPQNAYYKYIPMLNGPLLFHLQAHIFKLFGANDFTGRLLPALLGSGMLLIPFYFRKKIHLGLFLTILSLISFSPVFIYYSRFLRHEYLVIACYALFLYFIMQKPTNLKFFILPFLFWLHWCIKENVFVFAAILLGYFLYDTLLGKYKEKYLLEKESTSFTSLNFKFSEKIQAWWLLGGFAVGLLFFYLLYTNFGNFHDGFKSGLFDGLTYWYEQHSIERIKGPFSIHLMMFNWYELCAFLYICGALITQIIKHYTKFQKLLILYFTVILICICLIFSSTLLEYSLIKDFFKLKFSLDIFLFFFLLFIALLHTTILLLKNLKNESFFYYLFIAHFFTYSYLGEKVPWLVLYPLFFGLIYATFVYHKEEVWQKYFSWKINNTFSLSTVILLTLITSNLYQAIRLNFFRAANIQEFIIQVHPVHDYKNALNHILETIKLKKPLTPPSILMMDDATWISTWYFKNAQLPTNFSAMGKPLDQNDIILSKHPNLPLYETHNKVEVSYSGWWVPDYNKFNFFSFYAYAFNHAAWNESGLMKYYIYSRKGFYEP